MFVNVFGGITACDAVANGIVQALQMLADKGEPVTKPLVVRLDGNNADLGRQILDDAGNPRRGARGHHGRRRAPRGRARRPGGLTRWRSSSPRTPRSSSRASPAPRARKHTIRMLGSRREHRRGRHPRQGRPDRHRRGPRHPGVQLLPGGRGRHRRRRLGGLRAAEVHQGAPWSRRSTRRSRSSSSSPRASPVHDTAEFYQYAAELGHHAHHRPELPRPHQPRQVQRRHHPRRRSPRPAASAWCPSRAR